VRMLTADQQRCLYEEVLPALEKEVIVLRRIKDLSESERKHLRKVFHREIFPVLTPLAIDPGHPFPHLLNKTLNLAVLLHRAALREQLFAVVQVPSVLPRFLSLPSDKGHVLIALENVIRLHLDDLFPGMVVKHDTVFRVTRNSDFEIDDDDVEDLLKTIEEEVRKRRRGTAVRLQIRQDAPQEIERFLMASLDLEPSDVFRCPSLLDLTGM